MFHNQAKNDLTNYTLTKEQNSLVRGTLLGDGSFELPKRALNPRLCIIHGTKQSDYLYFKYSILKNLVSAPPRIHVSYHKRVGKSYSGLNFKTRAVPAFLSIYKSIYLNGKKQITEEYLNFLDDFAVAIWLCDDGSLKRKNNSPEFTLATCCFQYDENKLLINWFQDKYGLKALFRNNGKNVPKILAFYGQTNVAKLCAIIRKYNIPGMDYKIYE